MFRLIIIFEFLIADSSVRLRFDKAESIIVAINRVALCYGDEMHMVPPLHHATQLMHCDVPVHVITIYKFSYASLKTAVCCWRGARYWTSSSTPASSFQFYSTITDSDAV